MSFPESPKSTPHESAEAERRVQPVVTRLKALDLGAIHDQLQGKHDLDPTVGITIISLDVPPITLGDRDYHFHAAKFTTGAVVPHYHPQKGELPGQTPVTGPDDEPYRFITTAEMNMAPMVDGKVGKWHTQTAKPGEVIVVPPNVVHSARDGEIIFGCPHDHLSDYDEATNPEGNRVMVAKKTENGTMEPLLPNGVPPHYGELGL